MQKIIISQLARGFWRVRLSVRPSHEWISGIPLSGGVKQEWDGENYFSRFETQCICDNISHMVSNTVTVYY